MYAIQRMPFTHAACSIRAYAKINLTLDVVGRRKDGYHDLLTIMQTISLYDTIRLNDAEDDQVHLSCSVAELNTDDNLAMRAAQLVHQRCAIKQGLKIELIKRIPLAAGLGGGSSDAAAVLLALQQQWQLDLSDAELLDMATSLGSDVPFFLYGGLALCEGRGERITPLAWTQQPSLRWLLLLKPAISIATKTVFQNLPANDHVDGSHSHAVLAALNGQHLLGNEHLHNSLERSVLANYPPVALARQHLLEAGAPLVRLSGSGPTLFAPFAELKCAQQVQERLQSLGYDTYLTQAVPSLEKPA